MKRGVFTLPKAVSRRQPAVAPSTSQNLAINRCCLLTSMMLAMLCTPPPLLAPLLLESAGPFFGAERLAPFRAGGEIEIRVGTGSARASIDLTWHSDSQFVCNFYDPFGVLAARLIADADGTRAEYGDSAQSVNLSDSAVVPGLFDASVFTFRQVVRILTGRLPNDFSAEADVAGIESHGSRLSLNLRAADMQAEMVMSRNFRRIYKIRCAPATRNAWSIVYSRFSGPHPKRIAVYIGGSMSFVLRYERIILLSDSGHRVALEAKIPCSNSRGRRK